MEPQISGAFDAAPVLCAALTLLIPLAAAGLVLMNAGLGRSRSAAHSMLGSLCVVAVAAIAYVLCGFSWQGFAGRPQHSLSIAGRPWGWIAAEPFLMRGLALDGSRASLAAWQQMFAVAIAALIPLGAGNDRWRLRASCASTALLAGWTYPLFAHWVWGGGWLAQVGFQDAGGAAPIQIVGGLTAFAMVRILRPRRGKFAADGAPAAIPGHNIVLVLFGCFFTWMGWVGLNGSGALLFTNAAAGSVVRVAMVTTLSAAAGLLAAAGLTRMRFGRPDASLSANGWTAGLVASSAGCASASPMAAVLIGGVAGVATVFSVEWMETRLRLDDPAGSIAVHAVSGAWGLLALALFAQGQWPAQLLGLAALAVVILPMTWGLNVLLNRFCRQRVSDEAEPHGLDLYELGAEAYPEFLTRRDHFGSR